MADKKTSATLEYLQKYRYQHGSHTLVRKRLASMIPLSTFLIPDRVSMSPFLIAHITGLSMHARSPPARILLQLGLANTPVQSHVFVFSVDDGASTDVTM
jgi:hypothetical protein